MRLSTESDRDEARAIELLHVAFDSGVTFLDTADAYCLDDSETGHNERLIARAVTSWNGDRSRIIVATKGGLTRPQGQWVADGRARHLREACEASLRALDVERIDLYQLHAPDPRVPFATSVRAMAALKDEGLIARIGLCNVNVGQIEDARRIAEIAAAQVELSVSRDESLLNGVVDYCSTHRIQLIAYRPLGGRRKVSHLRHEPVLRDVAERCGATPAEVALAWLATVADHIVTIPGATRIETVQSIVRAHGLQLSAGDREQLDARFGVGASHLSVVALAKVEDAPLRARPERRGGSLDAPGDGEVVLIMGLPGAGKSTVARDYVDRGYIRLNRDDAGGSLRGLVPALEAAISNAASKIVLDNTYMSRASRARVVRAAHALGLPVRCVWLNTSVEDAQVNAVSRIIANHGRLLGPEEMKQAVTRDISAFAPTVQFRHQRELEPPDAAEGFSRIDIVAFERTRDPAMTNRALIVWCDGTLIGDVAADLQVRRFDTLRRHHAEGWLLLGLAWRPQIAERTMTREQVDADLARMHEQLGVAIEVLYCPHPAGPPICWCRKPLPGLGVVFIQSHRLDPSRCICVGSGPQDPGFARRLGFQYRDAADFFAPF